MGQTYTRQSAFSDGDTITASLFNNEFDQLVNAFNNSTGHTHDGTAGEGGPITVVGPNQDVSFGSTAVLPANNNTVNLGSASFQFKDGYFDGTVTLDGLVIGTSTSVTSVDTDLTSVSASDDTLASAKAIKAYVDAVVTAADLDFQADTGGALSIDLDSETLTIAGTANEIETAGSGNTVTIGLPNNVTIGNNLTVTNNLITNNDVQFTGTAGNIIFDKSADTLGLQDDVYLAFGDDDDFKIYHNGTNTVLVDANATSTIVVANDLGVSITNAAGTTPSATFVPSGAATLNYAGSAKVATKTDGIDVTGEVQSDSLDVDGNADISGNLVIGGNTTIGDANTDSVTVNAVVASDLVPYADGTYDLGSSSLEWQDLYIDGTAHVDAINYDGTLITATAAELNILDGVTADATEINLLDGVTATTAEINRLDVTTVGALEANKVLTADASGNINFSSANMTNVDIDSGTIDGATINTSNITVPATKTLDVSAGTLTLANDQISGDKVEGGTIAAITITDLTTGTITTTGDFTVGGDLTVNGTTTTINSTTLDVDDINITVAKGAADAAAANGAGLTVDGASATITYDSTADAWDFNKDIDVTGTVTADGLTVDSGTQAKLELNTTVSTGVGSLIELMHDRAGPSVTGYGDTLGQIDHIFRDSAGNYDVGVRVIGAMGGSSGDNTNGTERTAYTIQTLKGSSTLSNSFKIDRNGDISFYEDTGTTAKFFWDASDETLSVGSTTNNAGAISATIATGNYCYRMYRTDNQEVGGLYNATNGAALFLKDSSGNSDVSITSYGDSYFNGGNVGIGTSSPAAKLHVENGDIRIEKDTKATIGFRGHTTGSTALAFRDSNAAVDRMTIDSSGNLLVGKTSTGSGIVGTQIEPAGAIAVTRDGSTTAYFNRLTSDGDLVQFRKDGTTVGSIGVDSGGGLYVDFGDWTITESGGSLYFATGGTNKMKLDASGNLDVVGNVNANATIS